MPQKQVLVQLSLDDLIEFYETCKKLEIDNDDMDGKNAILFDIVSRQSEPHVWETGRSKEEIIKDLKANYGKVVDLTNDEEKKCE